MRVFITGATGFIGTAVVAELIAAGHEVVGLTRSDAGADALVAAGAEPHRGHLEDLESLRQGAATADAVIHAAFIHDFRDAETFRANCEIDRRAIEALGSALAGSGRSLIVSAGVPNVGTGRPTTEADDAPPNSPLPRVSEQSALAFASAGVTAMAVRLPQVHDAVKQGLVTYLVTIARAKGVSAYVADGGNRWAAAHVRDVARVYRLALEKPSLGTRFQAVGEEGVPLREIAEAIGRGLHVPTVSLSPEQAGQHFGFLATFAGHDLTASSALTQERLGWKPTGPGLIADLNAMRFPDAVR